jgi:long-chain acyl-CoA synthetase
MRATMMQVPLSLNHLLERAGRYFAGNEIVSRRPDRSLVRHRYGEFHRRTRALAAALGKLGLAKGERVATLCWNHHAHLEAYFGIPAAGGVMHTLNLRLAPDEIGWIAGDAEDRFLIVDDVLLPLYEKFAPLHRFERVIVVPFSGAPVPAGFDDYERLLADAAEAGATFVYAAHDENDPVAMCYTSGTTGRPKGVMLSHNNILSNTAACLQVLATGHDDVFLSFLPMSHTFERTCGYYLTVMAGSTTAYARSIPQLGEDLQTIRPTMLISVPRIYERIWGTIRARLDEGSPLRKKLFLFAAEVGFARFEHAQGRGPWLPSFLLWPLLNKLVAAKVLARLGGRLRYALSGGAALPPGISRVFIGLGLPILQGYGLTETSPVACANPPWNNIPASVGPPVPGVEVRIGNQGAVMIRGPNVMLGYWNNEEATRAMIQPDGWLNSGDTGRIGDQGHLFITGRLKEIIVLSNGEKVPPHDMEAAIARDPLFEQVMLLGEGKPFLTVMAVLNADHWQKLAATAGINAAASDALHTPHAEKAVLQRIAAQISEFPGFAQVRRATLTLEPWTVENGLLTPTMKLKRAKVMEKFNAEIDQMYAGH